jgi:hypothetical protein
MNSTTWEKKNRGFAVTFSKFHAPETISQSLSAFVACTKRKDNDKFSHQSPLEGCRGCPKVCYRRVGRRGIATDMTVQFLGAFQGSEHACLPAQPEPIDVTTRKVIGHVSSELANT